MAKNLGSVNVKLQLDELDPELSAAVYDVLVELSSSYVEHGNFPTMHHGYAVLLEEVDEAWDEIKKDNHVLAVKEMIQVAAMAIKFIMAFNESEIQKHLRKINDGVMTVDEAKDIMGHSDARPAAVTGELGDDANH